MRRSVLVLVLAAVTAPSGASTTTGRAQSEIYNLALALDQYHRDTGKYPGEETDENAFPALFEALFGKRGSGGGPQAPYMELREYCVAVLEPEIGDYRPAEGEEIADSKVRKFYLDPWGHPYVYRRIGSASPLAAAFPGKPYVIYSTGPDGVDQTSAGERGDDIDTWRPSPRKMDISAWIVLLATLLAVALIGGWAWYTGRAAAISRDHG